MAIASERISILADLLLVVYMITVTYGAWVLAYRKGLEEGRRQERRRNRSQRFGRVENVGRPYTSPYPIGKRLQSGRK